MAQLTDTTGYRPNLPKYQRRGVTRQDPKVSNPNAGIVQGADAKMWDSVAGSLQDMITVRAKMDLVALDMEKQKMTAEMNDYYLDQQNAMKEGVNGISDVLLTGSDFEDNYENGKLKVGPKNEVSIQPFKFDENKWSQKAIEQMSPMLKQADDGFRSSTRDLFWGQLQDRNNNMLNTLETRNLNALTNKLANYSLAQHEEEMAENKDIQTGNIQFKGKILGGGAGKYMRAKQGILENDFRNYRSLLKLKLDSKVMNKQQLEIRLQNYGKELGEIMFNDIASVDPDEALDLALNGDIRISKGDASIFSGEDMEDIVYTDTRITQYHLDKMKREKSELNVAKNNLFLTKMEFHAKDDPESFLNQFGAWIPGAIKKTTYKSVPVVTGKKPVYGEIPLPKQVAVKHKYNEEDRQNSLGIMYKAIGEKNGFTSPQHLETAIYKAIMLANGEQEKADKLADTEKQKDIRKNLLRFEIGFKGYIKNKNKIQAYNDVSKDYEEKDGRWVPKETSIKLLSELSGADMQESRMLMEKIVIGVAVEKPGSGLKDKMPALISAVNNYWTKRIMIDPSTNRNNHPLDDHQTYGSHLMNEEERKLVANIENGYKEIEFFNKNNFKKKSSNQLKGEAQALLRNNTNENNQRTTAFAYLWDNYYENTVKPRISALELDANKVFMQDLKYDFAFHLPLKDQDKAIPQEIRDQMDALYEQTGQDRTQFFVRWQSQGPGLSPKPIFSYVPEAIIRDSIIKMLPKTDKEQLEGK